MSMLDVCSGASLIIHGDVLILRWREVLKDPTASKEQCYSGDIHTHICSCSCPITSQPEEIMDKFYTCIRSKGGQT